MGLHILDSSVSGGGPKEDGGSREGGQVDKVCNERWVQGGGWR